MFSIPIDPNNKLDAAMFTGHYARTGHALIAHRESNDGFMFTVIRECC